VLLGRASAAAAPTAAGAAPSVRASSSGTAAGSATGVDVPHPIAPGAHWVNSQGREKEPELSVYSGCAYPLRAPGRRRKRMRRREEDEAASVGGAGHTSTLCTNRPGSS